MDFKMPYDAQTQIHDEIIKLLEQKKCTVRLANIILSRAMRTISGTAPVQFVEGLPYEF